LLPNTHNEYKFDKLEYSEGISNTDDKHGVFEDGGLFRQLWRLVAQVAAALEELRENSQFGGRHEQCEAEREVGAEPEEVA